MECSVHSGFETPTLSPRNTGKLELVVDERVNASLLAMYSETWGSSQMEIIASPYNSLTPVLKNDGSENVVLQISGSVRRDASLTLTLCELNAGNAQARVTLDLCEEGVFAMLHSACIATSHKQSHVQCSHLQAHTEGLMENYAVVEEGGQYRVGATGEIIKGARESNSHQKTRVLTVSKRHGNEVVPVLPTDENDIKVSHATVFGQPDGNQLYYLQTRGLSRRQALSLLTVGYVVPITELSDQGEVRTALKDEIEMKVGLHA